MGNTAELETVKKFYLALNQNDIPGILQFCDPQIERVEFEGNPSEGVFRGLSEFQAHLIKGRSTWDEGGCEPTRLVLEGDKVIVSVHVRVRLKNKTEWIDGQVTDVFAFRNGRITQMRSFLIAEEALIWARESSR